MKIDKVNEGYQDGTLPVEGVMLRPVHLSCVETCTDEEFGGDYLSEESAMKVARKHPHACQILPLSAPDAEEFLKYVAGV